MTDEEKIERAAIDAYSKLFCIGTIHANDIKLFKAGIHYRDAHLIEAKALKDAGCIIVKFGLESGSPRVRREILHRYMKNEQIERSFYAAHAYDLHSSAFIMFGLPYGSDRSSWVYFW